jgi:hypothetical protein
MLEYWYVRLSFLIMSSNMRVVYAGDPMGPASITRG